jgi:predicted small metal-binding protein
MAKMVDCHKINPSSDCHDIVRGRDEDEVMRRAAEHAREQHGLEPTEELMSQVRSQIEDEPART